MKVIEAVRFCGDMLKRLHDFGITTDDYRYLPLYDDFERMRSEGNKTTYIVATLSQRYGICERKVYKVVRRFAQDCQRRAVE